MSSKAKGKTRPKTSSPRSGRKKSSTNTSTTSFSASSTTPQPAPQSRDESGKFLPGVSGNPAGRPPSTRNRITETKQELELAVRQHMSPHKIASVVEKMYELAMEGSVGAAKLLLDKTISNAKTESEDQEGPGSVRIVIENMTLGDRPEVTVIEHPSPTPIED